MIEADVTDLIAQGRFEGNEPTSVETVSGHLCVNDLIALPVTAVDCSHNRSTDLEIEFDGSTVSGTLCYCRSPGQAADPYAMMSEWRQVAYLTEASKSDWGTDYHFRNDFLVIPKTRLAAYEADLLATAPIWGGFSHDPVSSSPSVVRAETKIQAQSGLKIPTTFHARSLQFSVRAAHPYDRFLRQYHQLELLFDWIFVKKIQALGADLEGVAKLMSEYSSGDLPRLKVILLKYFSDSGRVRDKLLMPHAHLTTAKEIFDINNKDGNPLKDKWDKFVQWHGQGMTESAAKSPAIKILGSDKSFDELIINIAAYWIYRIRCSIAHNRIGEYIMKESDEAFVVNFMEPLLREVLCQVFANPQLPS